MGFDQHRRAARLPLLTGIFEDADQLFLFGIHRNHRLLGDLRRRHRLVDVRELRVPIWILFALQHLRGALQAEALGFQQLPHQAVADLVTLCLQGLRQLAQALAGPAQRRLWIAARLGIHQRQQGRHHRSVLLFDPLATSARTTYPPLVPYRTPAL